MTRVWLGQVPVLLAVVVGWALLSVRSASAAGSAPYFSPLSASMTLAQVQPAAASLPNGEVLIAGGDISNAPTASAELFDPANGGSFTALSGSMTTARAGAVAATLPTVRC
jgi:hypothetical protein